MTTSRYADSPMPSRVTAAHEADYPPRCKLTRQARRIMPTSQLPRSVPARAPMPITATAATFRGDDDGLRRCAAPQARQQPRDRARADRLRHARHRRRLRLSQLFRRVRLDAAAAGHHRRQSRRARSFRRRPQKSAQVAGPLRRATRRRTAGVARRAAGRIAGAGHARRFRASCSRRRCAGCRPPTGSTPQRLRTPSGRLADRRISRRRVRTVTDPSRWRRHQRAGRSAMRRTPAAPPPAAARRRRRAPPREPSPRPAAVARSGARRRRPMSRRRSRARRASAARSGRARARLASVPPSGSGQRGGYLVQVSSQRAKADAQASFRSLQDKYSQRARRRQPIIRRADLGSQGRLLSRHGRAVRQPRRGQSSSAAASRPPAASALSCATER